MFLARVWSGDVSVIAVPMVLDEGVDVPEADLAIFVATSQQRRKMVERMGRALEVSNDGGRAWFAILFAENCFEDPAYGAHEDFLGEKFVVADEVRSLWDRFERRSDPILVPR